MHERWRVLQKEVSLGGGAMDGGKRSRMERVNNLVTPMSTLAEEQRWFWDVLWYWNN